MDFRAAARSVLLVGRLKNDRNIRVMVRQSSLAPEGNSRAFSLENGTLHWQKGYETLTADQLLSGRSQDSKLTLAEELILDTLDRRSIVSAKEMYRLAEQANISPPDAQGGQAQSDPLCGVCPAGQRVELAEETVRVQGGKLRLRTLAYLVFIGLKSSTSLCVSSRVFHGSLPSCTLLGRIKRTHNSRSTWGSQERSHQPKIRPVRGLWAGVSTLGGERPVLARSGAI